MLRQLDVDTRVTRPQRRRSARCSARRTARRRRTRSPGRSARHSSRPRQSGRSSCASTTSSGARRRSSTWSSTSLCSRRARRSCCSASRGPSSQSAAPLGRSHSARAARRRRRRRADTGAGPRWRPPRDRTSRRRQPAVRRGDARDGRRRRTARSSSRPRLRALLAARLDQLEAAERSVLERGAVEGEIFHRGARPGARARRTGHPASRGARAKAAHPTGPPHIRGEDGFRFRHLLIRDAAYDALPKSARADLHDRFAAWLEHHGAEARRARRDSRLPPGAGLALPGRARPGRGRRARRQRRVDDLRREVAARWCARTRRRREPDRAGGRAGSPDRDGRRLRAHARTALYESGRVSEALRRSEALAERSAAVGNRVGELAGRSGRHRATRRRTRRRNPAPRVARCAGRFRSWRPPATTTRSTRRIPRSEWPRSAARRPTRRSLPGNSPPVTRKRRASPTSSWDGAPSRASTAQLPSRRCSPGWTRTSLGKDVTTGCAPAARSLSRCSGASTRGADPRRIPAALWSAAAAFSSPCSPRSSRRSSSSTRGIPPARPSWGRRGAATRGTRCAVVPVDRCCTARRSALPAGQARRGGRVGTASNRDRLERGPVHPAPLAAGTCKGPGAPRRACGGGAARARGARDQRVHPGPVRTGRRVRHSCRGARTRGPAGRGGDRLRAGAESATRGRATSSWPTASGHDSTGSRSRTPASRRRPSPPAPRRRATRARSRPAG